MRLTHDEAKILADWLSSTKESLHDKIQAPDDNDLESIEYLEGYVHSLEDIINLLGLKRELESPSALEQLGRVAL